MSQFGFVANGTYKQLSVFYILHTEILKCSFGKAQTGNTRTLQDLQECNIHTYLVTPYPSFTPEHSKSNVSLFSHQSRDAWLGGGLELVVANGFWCFFSPAKSISTWVSVAVAKIQLISVYLLSWSWP